MQRVGRKVGYLLVGILVIVVQKVNLNEDFLGVDGLCLKFVNID